jgi:formate dehydrogenase iron-sulfur subunit
MLFDVTRCIGCEGCVEACREKNGLPETDDVTTLSAHRMSSLQESGDWYVREQCMHCLQPACVSVCPVGALEKTADGPVVYDADRCMGCRYCMVACPFGVPRYEWASRTPRMVKCQMCYERIGEGESPACAAACEEGATVFGNRDELLVEAHRRISKEPGTYAQHVFGEHEAGGTSFLIIGPPEVMAAFDKNIPDEALPEKTWAVLAQIPTAVGIAGVALLGTNWIIQRRMKLAKLRAEERSESFEIDATQGEEV